MYIYIYILYKIEFYSNPINLNVYVCEVLSWRLKSQSLLPTPHMHLYLWNNHRTKGVRGFYIHIFGLLINGHKPHGYLAKSNDVDNANHHKI